MDKKLRYINGTDVSHCKGFVFDGCHKIYVCENDEQVAEMKEYGYEELCPMSAIYATFNNSCPLRFISWADLHTPDIVPQCTSHVTFSYEGGQEISIDFDCE